MGWRESLSAALAVVGSLLTGCGDDPAPILEPASVHWFVFEPGEGFREAYQHDSEHRLTHLPAQAGTRSRLPEWPVRLDLRGAGLRIHEPRQMGTTPVDEQERGDPRAMERRLAGHPMPTDFVAEPQVRWVDVDAVWTTLAAIGDPHLELRVGGVRVEEEPAQPTGWPRRIAGARVRVPSSLLVRLDPPRDSAGPWVSLSTTGGSDRPAVSLRFGRTGLSFPGGDPYGSAAAVDAANTSWDRLLTALRVAGTGTTLELEIGPDVPWSHILQTLWVAHAAGRSQVGLRGRPYGLSIRTLRLDLRDAEATTDRASGRVFGHSPWTFLGAGIAVAALLTGASRLAGSETRGRRRG